MKLLLILLFSIPLVSGVYKAKVEPYERVSIASEVSGRIVSLDQKDELKMLDKKVLVIDHALQSIELKNNQKKLKLLKNQITIKQGQYNRIKNLQGQSVFTKERYQSELLNLKIQRTDLQNVIARLEDMIAKKEISLHNQYLKKLYVAEGSFVAPGSKLMDIEDHSGSRIVIYVDAKDKENIINKSIEIDGLKEHGYSVEKVANSTDEQYLSSYRVELVKEGEVLFGKIVRIVVGE